MQWSRCLYFLVFVTSAIAQKKKCSITVRPGTSEKSDLPQITPLVLNSGKSGFRYPTTDGKLGFVAGDKVRLVCSGQGNYFKNLPTTPRKQTDIIAECVEGITFKVGKTTKKFEDLGCFKYINGEQKTDSTKCLTSHTKYKIGFTVGNGFEELIEVCHDLAQIKTLYTKFRMVKEIGQATPGRPTLDFQDCPDHAPLCYKNYYSRGAQIETFGRILGSADLGKAYVTRSGMSYLSRGHLAASADFVYHPQKRATYWYINQAPQWQLCNGGGGWSYVEQIVRDYASHTYRDLTVYTGVHETAQLPDSRKEQANLYLKFAGTNSVDNDIPIPKFFWKVVYDESTKEGIAFVQVNDYCDKVFDSANRLCNSIVIPAFDVTNLDCLTYTCEVDELKRKIPIPQLTITGVLGQYNNKMNNF